MKYLISAFACLMLLSSCAAQNKQGKNQFFDKKEWPGCISVEKINNTYTPEELIQRMAVCVKQEKFEKAAYMYHLYRIYGQFDKMRVNDPSAAGALNVLAMDNMGPVDEEKTDTFHLKLGKEFNKGSAYFNHLCGQLERIGPPNYHPDYMIQHGMKAVLNKVKNKGLVENFNPQVTWNQLLSKGCKVN